MAIQIQVKRGVQANRPALAPGEFYFATDTQQLNIGNASGGIINFIPVVASQFPVNQSAAIASTLLYTVPAGAGGIYRITWFAKVTRAATTSSTMGGLTITYTENTDSTSVSVLAQGVNSVGTAVTTISSNSATSTGIMSGVMLVDAKASTAINFAFAYVSSGATTMQYKLHIKVDAL